MYLTQAVRRAAQTGQNKVATLYKDRRRTWGEFEVRVAKLAGALRQLGLESGDRVAILSLNSDRYLEYYFAVPWAGGVVVPMNIRWSVLENVYSLNDSGSKFLLVDDAFQAQIPQIRSQAETVQHYIFTGDGPTPEDMLNYETILAEAASVEDAMRMGEDLAGIFYTGGTTGFPKGVMLPHRALWTNGMATMHEVNFTGDTVYLHAAPMFHLADGAGGMASTIAGATHAIIPAFNPEHVLKAIEAYHVTHSLLVPTMIKVVLDYPGFDTADLSSLKAVIYGASPIPEAVLRTAIQKLPHCTFTQAYGQTELAPCATFLPPDYHVLEGPKSTKLRSAGRATYCVEVKVIDLDGNEVPRGTVGEVAVFGPNTMQGYWNKPAETGKALVNGWVRTGDGAYMDSDGFIYIVDRLKDMIITGGENVYSVEVENAVASHPGVSSCAVIGVPDERWGERVHAVVVKKPGVEVTAESIMEHCHNLIANYKCPRSVEFIEALPLSGAGKILKRDLRAPYWEGAQRQVN